MAKSPSEELRLRSRQNGAAQLVPELVSAHASSTPDVLAVTDGNVALNYGELELRASQLACHLRSLGVDVGSVVAVCFKRSVAMVVGALAVLKAGGAYLPMDPDNSRARLAFQLDDAQVSVLLTGQCVVEQLPHVQNVVRLDSSGNVTSPVTLVDCSDTVVTETTAESLAYVVYTSGSSGQPKGVEITHGSLSNLVAWHKRTFDVTAADRAALQASPGFDAAVWELWPNLAAGASVHVVQDDTRNDPVRLRDWLVQHALTISFVATPMAEQLMFLDWPPDAALRFLLTGADTLHHYPPSRLPFAVVNNYGPTECTVVTTSGIVRPETTADRLPSIGAPITNVQVYILDEDLRPLPAGEVGEIYIGGLGVGRGYRNKPALTSERFITNPFANESGLRLYKTGDLGYVLPDGQIAFLGRCDDQVKIRGYRIEPSEIVTVLDQHPMVQASVVVAREDTPGNRALVAYIVPGEKSRLTVKILREFLLSSLPEYMVPGVFCTLDSLPLAASGKVDRKALPPPAEAHLLGDEQYVAPTTPVEQRMTGILVALLHQERVGVNDNFFLLGVNSLLGAQVVARVRDVFGVELPLLTLFDHPTIAGVSVEIERLLVAKLETMSEDLAERLATEMGAEV